MASFGSRLFGLFIKNQQEEQKVLRSPVSPSHTDSAIEIGSLSGMTNRYGQDNGLRSETALINKYRNAAMSPVIDAAVVQIVTESIVNDNLEQQPVELTFPEKTVIPVQLQATLKQEFDTVLSKLDFRRRGHDIFRRWYVDGRIYFHKVIDEANPQNGIEQLRYIDPRKIKMVREYVRDLNTPIDQFTGIQQKFVEYWIFNDNGIDAGTQSYLPSVPAGLDVVRFTKDAIAYSTSGLWDTSGKLIISHLHKTLRILNQYLMLEDSVVIYRVTRSVEKRKFLIDVGNLPRPKAEQAFRDIMAKFKNKLTYSSVTGEISEDRRFAALTEDYWFAIRDGQQKTDVEQLAGATQIGVVDDLTLFKQQLYRSLNVPLSRLDTEQSATIDFGQGGSQISREELLFHRFIKMLQQQFADLFADILRTQVILKGIMTAEEWEEARDEFIYRYAVDSYFAQAKEIEILNQRIQTLVAAQPLVGTFFSRHQLMKKVLELDDEEIEELEIEMEQDRELMLQQEVMAAKVEQGADDPTGMSVPEGII